MLAREVPRLHSSSVLGASSGSALGALILGLILLAAAWILRRVEPRFQSFLEETWFRGRQLPGRDFRMRGGPFLLVVFGVLLVAGGIAGLA